MSRPALRRIIPRFITRSALFAMLCSFPGEPFAQVLRSAFEFEGVRRDYIVFLPKRYDGRAELPLVLNLHGATLSADQQMHYSRMNMVADTAGFIVVYPDAHETRWNAGITGNPVVNDVGFISALIDTVSRRFRVNQEMIFSCGFSLGGFMSFRLACELSERIAAAASVAGGVSRSVAAGSVPTRRVPVLIMHGTADSIVEYHDTSSWLSAEETVGFWASFNGSSLVENVMLPDSDSTDGSVVQKMSFGDGTGMKSVVFYRVIGGGHTWPLGNEPFLTINWGNIGETNADISASEEIWKYFRSSRLPAAVAVETPGIPAWESTLSQNYPNPFNPGTSIQYVVGGKSDPGGIETRLVVYDLLGREVAVLVDERKVPGSYEVAFDASGLSSGVYIYRLTAGAFTTAKKLMVLE